MFYAALVTPCNTPSKLRGRPLPGGKAPMLRSGQHLLGLPCWTTGAALGRKVRQHNLLLEHSLATSLAASFFGGGGRP